MAIVWEALSAEGRGLGRWAGVFWREGRLAPTSVRVDLKGRSLNEKNELEGGVQYSCDGLSCSPSIGRQSASGGQRWSNINSERNFNSPISTVTASRRVLLVFGPTPFKRPGGPSRVSTPRLNMGPGPWM
jgi:hypothetical protein